MIDMSYIYYILQKKKEKSANEMCHIQGGASISLEGLGGGGGGAQLEKST